MKQFLLLLAALHFSLQPSMQSLPEKEFAQNENCRFHSIMSNLNRRITNKCNHFQLCGYLDWIINQYPNVISRNNQLATCMYRKQPLANWLIFMRSTQLLNHIVFHHGENCATKHADYDTAFHVLCCLFLSFSVDPDTKQTTLLPLINHCAHINPALLHIKSTRSSLSPIDLVIKNFPRNNNAIQLANVFNPFLTDEEQSTKKRSLAAFFERFIDQKTCLCCMNQCYCCSMSNPSSPHYFFWINREKSLHGYNVTTRTQAQSNIDLQDVW